MNKKNLKKIISLLCAAILVLSITATQGNSAKATDAEAVAAEASSGYRELTFADFNIADQTLATGNQFVGTLGSDTSLDGVAVSGYVTLGYTDGGAEQSFRIGGTEETSYLGIGLYADSATTIYLCNYTSDRNGSLLKRITPSACGISYTEGVGFSPFLVRMTFDYVAGTSKVMLNVLINGNSVYSGTLASAGNTLGTGLFLWAYEAPIGVQSVSVNDCFGSSTAASGYFCSYYSVTTNGFLASSFDDYWTVADGVLTRKQAIDGDMAMLVLKDRTYKNFELSLSYYQAAGGNESLILGMGASQMGMFFTEDAGGYGIAVSGKKLCDHMTALDTDAFLSEGWHKLTLTVTGRILRVYVDEKPEVTTAVLPTSYEGGYVYLAAGNNGASVKDLSISPLAYRMTDFGDANNDGTVDIGDVVRLKKALQGKETIEAEVQYMDFNSDICFQQNDLAALRQNLLGGDAKTTVVNSFPWGSDVMPIGGYYGPTEELITDEFYQALQEMGLNVITTPTSYCDYYSAPENCLKTLELGDKYGIYTYVMDSYLNFNLNLTEDAIRARLQNYAQYDSFAGIRLVDEPTSDVYMPYGEGAERKLSQYTQMATLLNRVCGGGSYVNLFPYYQNLDNVTWEGYQSYVQEYIESIEKEKMISYDHYVIDSGNAPMYFKNMSLIRDAAQEQNIPFWAFVQAGKSVSSGRNPTEKQFYWNVNTSLAMGAKGIQYFPMVQPKTSLVNGLFLSDGTKTAYYGYAKNIYQQIANMDHILMNSTHEGILAVGNTAISDTADVSCRLSGASFRELSNVTASDNAGVIVGCFDYNGKTALYVVNNSVYISQTVNLAFDSSVHLTQYTDSTTDLGNMNSLSVTLNAGSAVLLIVD